MTKVECPMITCVYNKRMPEKNHGICNKDNIYLKWRFGGDFGKGKIFAVECLNFEIIEKE